jgi:hypothetical protein
MEEKPVNKNRTILIVAAVVVALGCCCLAIGIAGFYLYTTPFTVESSMPTPEESFNPQLETDMNEPPSGGLGNDILRKDTWQTIAPAAVGLGCDQPLAKDSIIEVLQQPDAAGVWVEQWTVACASGKTYAFEVEYVLDATGATFNIKSLP